MGHNCNLLCICAFAVSPADVSVWYSGYNFYPDRWQPVTDPFWIKGSFSEALSDLISLQRNCRSSQGFQPRLHGLLSRLVPLYCFFFRMISAHHLAWTPLGNSTKERFQWLSLASEEKALLCKTFSLCSIANGAVKYGITRDITDYLHSSWKPFQRTFHKAELGG